MNPKHATFGKALMKHRTQAGKTLEQVASHIGISVSYLSDIERGARYPMSSELVSKVASFLDTDARRLHQLAAEAAGGVWLQVSNREEAEAAVGLLLSWEEGRT